MQSDLSFLSRRIKLVATDLDGTLLNRSHDVSERTVEAVRAASHKGLEVVICTGRRFASCLPILEKIKCADEVVVNNGIVVKDAKTQRTIDSMYMDAAVYRGALDILRRIDLPSVVLVDDFPGKDILIEAPEGSNEYHLEFVSHNSEYCSTVSELSSVSSDRLIEIVAFERYERLREAEVEIKKSIADSVDCFTIRGIRYKGCSLELMPKGASKWRAVQHIMKLRGVFFR